jgi:signal transduction histidine kinase/CheY-like chemotaxis protein
MSTHSHEPDLRVDTPPAIPTHPLWLANLTRAGYTPLLERLVAGSKNEDLPEALEMVVHTVEAQVDGMIGSILLLDKTTQQLRHGAGGRLPQHYRDAIDGIVIGPKVGSCGTAAWLKDRVIVADIDTDPKWVLYRDLAHSSGLGACWSQPILDGNRVLGTFAMYYAQPRTPTGDELLVIDAAAHLARLAIERHQSRVMAAEQRKLDERLARGQKMESMTVLAGGVAHDFNNLLVSILGSADLAEQQIPSDSPVLADLQRIQSAALACSELCKQLLAYAGKGKLVVQSFYLPSLIQDMGRLVEVSLPKSIALVYQFASDLPSIEGDPIQIQQVVMNLLTNAAEAIESKNGVITVNVALKEVTASDIQQAFDGSNVPPGAYVRLKVSDTGCGMNTDTTRRIFDPFYTTKSPGRGLGLAAVLGIVRSHEGFLRVHSEPGKGSSFELSIPASIHQPGSLGEPALSDQDFVGHGTVLVVDDDDGVRTVASKMLELTGFTVLTANDGREAVVKYRLHQHEIRAVLLDMMMPHLDGEGTLETLRRINPEVKVIVSSGYSERELTNQCTGIAPKQFLKKPYRYADLISAFRHLLDNK